MRSASRWYPLFGAFKLGVKMDLRRAIIFILASIIYTIILKIGKILTPGIFSSIYITQTAHILSFLVGLFSIIFGLYFIKEVIGKNNIRLKSSVYLALIGPAFLMLIHLSDFIRLSNKLSLKIYDFSPSLYNLILVHNVKPFSQIVLWLSSIFIFYFFFILYNNLSSINKELKKANYLVLFGTALNAVFRSFGLIIYLLFPKSGLIIDPPMIIFLIAFLIFLFTSLVSLNFFLKLYRVEDYSKIL
jgi:hypothetical protein